MIDTYMDRADAAVGWRAARDNHNQQIYEDPRYYNGALYMTMADRRTAEARDSLAGCIDRAYAQHRWEIHVGVRMGERDSLFWADGTRRYR